MPNNTQNGTIGTGGTAQDALPAGNNFISVILTAGVNDLRFSVGSTASSTLGEALPSGSSATVKVLGQQLSIWGANTGDDYVIRPTL